jgi:hypothetical protein
LNRNHYCHRRACPGDPDEARTVPT